MDIIGRISRDIENEGIYLSNEKILKICQALKQLVKTYYRIYVRDSTAPLAEGEQYPDHFADINGRLTAQLTLRANLKEGIINSLVTCLHTMLYEQLTHVGPPQEGIPPNKRIFQQINLRQLISFDIAIKHDVCTEHCKQLKKTSAVMMFKIAEPSPLSSSSDSVPNGYTTKTVECSLDEVKLFREEMQRIQEAL